MLLATSAVVALGARVACNGDVDLRQLRYFVAVAEARGFRSASRALFVAQPALSSALQQLEGELGVELLHRTARGVALTDAGRALLTHAHSILRQTDEATAAMRECARRQPGIRVGVVAGVLAASELTAPIVQDYREARPDLLLELEELSFCDQVSPLLSGHFDVALVRDPLQHVELEVVPIALERRALMVGAEHELAEESEVDVADVLRERTLPLGAPGSGRACGNSTICAEGRTCNRGSPQRRRSRTWNSRWPPANW